MLINEDNISTQISLNSPGDAVYILEQIYTFAKENWMVIFALLVILGGGSACSFHVPGLIDIIKNIINIPSDIKLKHMEVENQELEIMSKRLEVYNKIKSSGINPKDLENPLTILCQSAESLNAEPIILENALSTPIQETAESEILDSDVLPE